MSTNCRAYQNGFDCTPIAESSVFPAHNPTENGENDNNALQTDGIYEVEADLDKLTRKVRELESELSALQQAVRLKIEADQNLARCINDR